MARQNRRTAPPPADPSDDEQAPERSVTGAAFWALIDRWGVADAAALRMIGGPQPARPGVRPRFRLRGPQVDTYDLLRAIDRHLEDLYGAARGWLSRTNGVFGRRTPIDVMAEGGVDGVAEVLRALEREAFKASLRGAGRVD